MRFSVTCAAVLCVAGLMPSAALAQYPLEATADIIDGVAWVGNQCPAQRTEIVAGAIAGINALPERSGRATLSAGIDSFDTAVADLMARPEEAANAQAITAAALNGALTVVDPRASYIDVRAFRATERETAGTPKPPAVQWRHEGHAGIITVSQLTEDSARKAAEAVRTLRQEADAPKGYVIDLRGNGGGLLWQVPEVAGVFIGAAQAGSVEPSDTCFAQEGMKLTPAKGARDETAGAPVVVLIDRGTASGAELIAAALKDVRGSVLIGERSYGRDNVDTVQLANARMAMRIPTGRLVGPKGRSLKGGLTPDIATPARTEDADPALKAALDLLAR